MADHLALEGAVDPGFLASLAGRGGGSNSGFRGTQQDFENFPADLQEVFPQFAGMTGADLAEHRRSGCGAGLRAAGYRHHNLGRFGDRSRRVNRRRPAG